MKLTEWDYEFGQSGGMVEVEYPDHVIKKFVDWFRLNKQWREREDTGEMVFRRFLHFENELTDAKNDAARADAAAKPVACTKTTKAGNPCKNTTGVVDGLCHIHRRTLAAV